MTLETAREIAARIWCDPEYSHVEMDCHFAEAIAILLWRYANEPAPDPQPDGGCHEPCPVCAETGVQNCALHGLPPIPTQRPDALHQWKRHPGTNTPDGFIEPVIYCNVCGVERNDDNENQECSTENAQLDAPVDELHGVPEDAEYIRWRGETILLTEHNYLCKENHNLRMELAQATATIERLQKELDDGRKALNEFIELAKAEHGQILIALKEKHEYLVNREMVLHTEIQRNADMVQKQNETIERLNRDMEYTSQDRDRLFNLAHERGVELNGGPRCHE